MNFSLRCFLRAGFAALSCLISPLLLAQAGPEDFDFVVMPEKETVIPGETFTVEFAVNTRCCQDAAGNEIGGEGWSYGVQHDTSLLEILEVTIAGTDAAGLGGDFEDTRISMVESERRGFTQAFIPSFTEPVFVPTNSVGFTMARATYRVNEDACAGGDQDITTAIQFTAQLPAGDSLSQPVGILFSVGGFGLEPAILEAGDVVVACGTVALPPLALKLHTLLSEGEDSVLAVGETLSLDVAVENTSDVGTTTQGWSYAVEFDQTVASVESFVLGDDALSVKEGGPDFESHSIEESGVVAGVLVDVSESTNFSNDLILPGPSTRNLGRLVLRGAGMGQTTLSFRPMNLPGNILIENLFTIREEDVEPDTSETLALNIVAPEGGLRLDLVAAADDSSIAVGETLTLSVNADNDTETDAPLEGWSYTIVFDQSVASVDSFGLGSDAAAVKAGGPDFESHTIEENGVVGGVVVEVNQAPMTDLVLPARESRELGSLVLRGAQEGQTTLNFGTMSLPGGVIIENLFTIMEQDVIPDSSDTLEVTVSGATELGQFLRGDANNDAKINIADAIWIVQFVFYDGPRNPCYEGAADPNDDGLINIADIMFIINWQLQPGKQPGDDLFPQPLSPFPGCGIDPDLSPQQCPRGSTPCDA